jgi:hypothetical protein
MYLLPLFFNKLLQEYVYSNIFSNFLRRLPAYFLYAHGICKHLLLKQNFCKFQHILAGILLKLPCHMNSAAVYSYCVHRKKKVREFPVPSRDVTTKLFLGGNNDVITELFLPRGSLVSDIPAGDGKLVNLFLRCMSGWLARAFSSGMEHLSESIVARLPPFGPIEGQKCFFFRFQPIRVSEEPVCIYLFRQNPVFTSLHLRSPVPFLSYRLWGIDTL